MARILIIDDNSDSAESTAMLLRLHGHETETALDGGDGMLKLGTFMPNLVLLDLMLPTINGWEFLDSKAKIPTVAEIPVVVMSGFANIDQPTPGKVVAILEKPTEPDELINAIKKALGV